MFLKRFTYRLRILKQNIRLDTILWNKTKVSLATATLIKVKLLDLRSCLVSTYATLDLLVIQLLDVLKKGVAAAVSSST